MSEKESRLMEAWRRQLAQEYRQLCWLYRVRLRLPLFEIREGQSRAGSWSPGLDTLSLASWLIRDHSWDVVLEVLKHEMSHQYVQQVMGRGEELPHGPAFQEACDRLGVHPEFRAAQGAIPRLLSKEGQKPGAMLSRVEKLFALAQSANVHEAALAMEKANAENYSFIIDWIKAANNALLTSSQGAADVFFSPGEECRNAIINRINGAIHQIGICVFTISDDRITDAIVTAHKKGVNVKIITDNDKSWDEGSDIKQLARAGVSIKMDSTPNHMHHKFMVVDNKSLLTGSYNWTMSAMRYNHGNILITEETGVVRSFLKEFDNLWRQMIVYK